MSKVVALVRVSSEKQSPQAQRAALADYAARARLTIDEWLDEGTVSGALDESKRPVLAALMDRIRARDVSTLLIAEWSRLGRDALAQLQRALEIQRAGCRVIALDDSKRYDLDDADDLLLFFILTWKDHRARLDTKARTRRAAVRREGRRTVSVHGKAWGRKDYVWTPEQDAALLTRAPHETVEQLWKSGSLRVTTNKHGPIPPGRELIRERLRVLRAQPAHSA